MRLPPATHQQKLISKIRDGAKITKKYDAATTPHSRAQRHTASLTRTRTSSPTTYTELNPAAVQRDIQALTDQLLKITTSKATAPAKPSARATRTRAPANESTTKLRAHVDMIQRAIRVDSPEMYAKGRWCLTESVRARQAFAGRVGKCR